MVAINHTKTSFTSNCIIGLLYVWRCGINSIIYFYPESASKINISDLYILFNTGDHSSYNCLFSYFQKIYKLPCFIIFDCLSFYYSLNTFSSPLSSGPLLAIIQEAAYGFWDSSGRWLTIFRFSLYLFFILSS